MKILIIYLIFPVTMLFSGMSHAQSEETKVYLFMEDLLFNYAPDSIESTGHKQLIAGHVARRYILF